MAQDGSNSAVPGQTQDPTEQCSYLLSSIVVLCIETGLYAISMVIFAVSTYLLSFTGHRSKPGCTMWLATGIMFAVSSSHYAVTWLTTITSNKLSSIEVSSSQLGTALQFLPVINYVFSDLIVLWRAWVLWDRDISPRVMGFFVFIWAGTMVTAIACAETTNTDSFVSGTGLSAFEDGKTGTNRTYSQWFVWGMSLSANVMGTGLIGFKAWRHRSSIRAYFEGREGPSRIQALLYILTESGLIYCGVWVVYIASQVNALYLHRSTSGDEDPDQPVFIFAAVMPVVLVQVSGIYPTAIVVLVALHKTLRDMTASQQDTPTQALEFAMRNVPSSVVSRMIGLRTRQSIQPSAVHISFDQAGSGDFESSVGLTRTSDTAVLDGHAIVGQIEDEEAMVSGRFDRVER